MAYQVKKQRPALGVTARQSGPRGRLRQESGSPPAAYLQGSHGTTRPSHHYQRRPSPGNRGHSDDLWQSASCQVHWDLHSGLSAVLMRLDHLNFIDHHADRLRQII